MPVRTGQSLSFLPVAAMLAVACSRSVERAKPSSESLSPSARPELVEALRQDLAAERHSSDGGGRVWLEEPREAVQAGRAGRWIFTFEAGPEGIRRDGWLFFQAPPFWGWSTPQTVAPDLLGYTLVETDAEGVKLLPTTADQQLLAIQILEGDLKPGEQIRITYGVGAGGALADRYAESRSCFYFAVDGNADGIRSLVPDQPCIEIEAGPAAQLVLTLPSTARPGDRVALTAAVLDAGGNRAGDWTGSVSLQGSPGIELPDGLRLEPSDAGATTILLDVSGSGLMVVRGTTAEGLVAESNPIQVADSVTMVLWADLHGHSGLSDGTGTPSDYFRYARDVAALDVVALTDHDHWGMEPLAMHPELWQEIQRETELFHEPGRFVTILGYEWTSWIHGHRHVLYFSDQGEIFDSVDEAYESPLELWSALRGLDALTFAHHSAGGPVATNWSFPPDPELEPVTEIVSVHGSSEAVDSPGRIYSSVAGNFVRDILDRGHALGFIGSGDSHDGHPGLAHLNAVTGGLAAILSEDLSREGVLAALRSRRVYATSGPRILLQLALGDNPMGSILGADRFRELDPERRQLSVEAVAPGALERVDIVWSGEVIDGVECDGNRTCRVEFQIEGADIGDYIYVRVAQEDGGTAWSSPIFFR